MTAFNNLASYTIDTLVDDAISYARATLVDCGIFACGLVLYMIVLAALWTCLHVLWKTRSTVVRRILWMGNLDLLRVRGRGKNGRVVGTLG
ncbi:hypothetical protein Tdes44962_MAKER02885 [Teratosphaeria destructans]|uniref:Uncharacterized protein n=1 Tax=Teratosphaeria destructans TaxID=418781 RepID=A0A9W7W221_9PEZI|nr:hypothetical protein Tdes44962_MAKER02885 [Teratosphaeria destructans]